MTETTKRIWVGAAFLAVISVIGVVGYVLAGWSPLEAIYMVVITVFGVGYGEVQPITSPGLRVFTILLIICGCSALIYILGGFFQMITEGYIDDALGKRRMNKEIEKLADHVIVCGYGRIGIVLAEELRRIQTPLVIIDASEARVAEAVDDGHLAFCADATEEENLRAIGIERAKAVASALPNDALNVFITLTARTMNPTLTIVARAESRTAEPKLRQAGADKVVLPSGIGAMHMAHSITRPSALELFEGGGLMGLRSELAHIGVEIGEIEVSADSDLGRSTVGEVEASGGGGFMVVAVRRGTETTQNPPQSFKLAVGDQVLLLGHADNLPKFEKQHRVASERVTIYRGARIRR